jgi:hypothetical protein
MSKVMHRQSSEKEGNVLDIFFIFPRIYCSLDVRSLHGASFYHLSFGSIL